MRLAPAQRRLIREQVHARIEGVHDLMLLGSLVSDERRGGAHPPVISPRRLRVAG